MKLVLLIFTISIVGFIQPVLSKGKRHKYKKQSQQTSKVVNSTIPTHEAQQFKFSQDIVPELKEILQANQKIVAQNIEKDPQFYSKHYAGQKPKYLWIGCSDSRVPAEAVIGAKVGDLFVHRNVANQVSPGDPNIMAVIQYAIKYLKIQNIIVAGHTNCGGIKAALTGQSFGPLQFWLHQIRDLAHEHYQQLQHKDENLKLSQLVQINVKDQVQKLSKAGVVQEAWHNKQKLNIFGVVYNLESGLLKPVGNTMKGLEDVPDFKKLYDL